MRGLKTPLLDLGLVTRIAAEEAQAANLSVDRLLGLRVNEPALSVRTKAWRRIIAETGCTRSELAQAWGVDKNTVTHALGANAKPSFRHPASPYDKATIARLNARHGPARTADIIAGRDGATNADIAAWKRLCARAD